MSSPTVQHPDDRLIVAFNLGKLDDREAAAINKHLKECQACRRRLVRLSAEFNVPASAPTGPAPDGGVDALAAAVNADRQDGSAIFQNTRARPPAGIRQKFVWPSAIFGLLLLGLVIAWVAGAFKAKTSAALTPPIPAETAAENRPAPVQPESAMATGERPTTPATEKETTPNAAVAVTPSTPSTPPATEVSEIKNPPNVENPADRAIQAAITESRPQQTAPPTKTAPPTNSPPTSASESPQEFFNGKDLAGWQGSPDVWRVENGSIVGSLPAGQTESAFLSSRQKYKDFDLRFRATVADGVGDCGVQFRSLATDSGKLQVIGPQCAIYGKDSPKDRRTGSLITEPHGKIEKAPPPKRVERFVKPAENFFRIRCQGKHILIEVNGIKMVNGEFPSLPEEGVIAWKIDGSRPPHKATFKIMKFTVLSGSPPQVVSDHPSLQDPELLKAELKFESSAKRADETLLKHFDPEINKLAHSSRAADKLMAPVVEHEKELFKEKGLVPFSRPMRKALLQYGKDLREAQRTVGNAFDGPIDRAEKNHNDQLKLALLEEAGQVLAPREVATWEFTDKQGRNHRMVFYSDGTFVMADRPGKTSSRFWMPPVEDVILLEFPEGNSETIVNHQGFLLSPDGKTLTTVNKKNEKLDWQHVEE